MERGTLQPVRLGYAEGDRVGYDPPRTPVVLVGCVTSVLMLVIAATARLPNYHTAPAFLVPIVWAAYLLRRKLYLHPFHYPLFCSAMLLHNLGAYGCYQRSYFGFSFDHYVHFWFGVVGTLALRRALGHSFGMVGPWQLALMTLLFVMGAGAIHEIMEYCSFLLLGEKGGMLKPSTSDFFDTQKDLSNNLLGALAGLIAWTVYRFLAEPKAIRVDEQRTIGSD